MPLGRRPGTTSNEQTTTKPPGGGKLARSSRNVAGPVFVVNDLVGSALLDTLSVVPEEVFEECLAVAKGAVPSEKFAAWEHMVH